MMAGQGKQVTKSIRLTEEEARILADLVQEEAASESALMRQWVLNGMRRLRIDQAASAYQRDDVDLREGAALAGIPIGVFVEELAERRISLLDDPEMFERELGALRATFGGDDDLVASTVPARASRSVEKRTRPRRADRALSRSG